MLVLPHSFSGTAIVACQTLTTKRPTRVARLTLRASSGNTSTMIVKWLDVSRSQPETADRDVAYFQEERLNYLFLESLRPRFPFAPRLLGETVHQLYLEDLGATDPPLSAPMMIDLAASTLATLHACTAEEEPRYRQLRRDLGMPPPESDPRLSLTYSEPQAFDDGAAMLSRWCSILVPERATELDTMLMEARDTIIQQERGSRAFVHHDLVSSRQCVVRGRNLFLVDFEHGRFDLRLMDLAKLMIGKLEVTEDDSLLHIHPSLPPSVATIYRRRWDETQVTPTPDAVWRAELRCALLWQTVGEVGRCVRLSKRTFVLGLPGTIRSFLHRLLDQFIALDDADPLRTVLLDLSRRLPTA